MAGNMNALVKFDNNRSLPQGFQVTASPAMISSDQLSTLIDQINKATEKAQTLICGRSEAELTARLNPDSWSVAQCLDHLAQTASAFLPAISDAIANAPNLSANRSLRTGVLARLLIWNMEPPYRFRFKVLAPLSPSHQDFASAWEAFLKSQSQLLEVARSSAGLAIDEVKLTSPVYAHFSYNVYGALRMLLAHQHRHLWQIEQIFKALDAIQVHKTSFPQADFA